MHGGGAAGVIEMNSNRERKLTKRDHGKLARERQEAALDDALKGELNTVLKEAKERFKTAAAPAK